MAKARSQEAAQTAQAPQTGKAGRNLTYVQLQHFNGANWNDVK